MNQQLDTTFGRSTASSAVRNRVLRNSPAPKSARRTNARPPNSKETGQRADASRPRRAHARARIDSAVETGAVLLIGMCSGAHDADRRALHHFLPA